MLCDLCIIQLNVAYNFKRLVIESNNKLEQFVIEKGLNRSALQTVTDGNTVDSPLLNVSTAVEIKTESEDPDNISEITICTNTDSNTNYINVDQLNNSSNNSCQQITSNDNHSITMVQLSSETIQTTTHTNTDIDFINTYLPSTSLKRAVAFRKSKKGIIVANKKVYTKSVEAASSSKSKQSIQSINKDSNKLHTRELANLYIRQKGFKRPSKNPVKSKSRLLRSKKLKKHKKTSK